MAARPQSSVRNLFSGAGPKTGSIMRNRPTVTTTNVLRAASNKKSMSDEERGTIVAKALKIENELPQLHMDASAISVFSYEQMQSIAAVKIEKKGLGDKDSMTIGTVNDSRMGVVSLTQQCDYCHRINCPGHYGIIHFGAKIYNPLYIKLVAYVLTCVCHDCRGLLISEEIIKTKGFNRLPLEKRLAAMADFCKGDLSCLRDKPTLAGGKVTPCSKNPVLIITDIKDKGDITYKAHGSKKDSGESAQILPINDVYNIINAISDTDARLLGFGENNHPRNMIMQAILVPPIIARPPVYEGGTIQHDQLTHAYSKIVERVQQIEREQNNGTRKTDPSNDLYHEVKQLIFKTDGKRIGMRDFTSLIERVQGKKAIMRELLMGKRVNWCGRTVAGPDATLEFGEVRIPKVWAPILTKPVKVTRGNIDYLTDLLSQGKITHIKKSVGMQRSVDPKQQYTLRVGDIVNRWLQNGDRVVINRQPTLHKESMMSYKVVLGNEYTIGLHLSYTSPMNCDFDGDENNMWAPQDIEVESEAEMLLNVTENLMSAEQNKPTMGLVMNSVSGAYLLTVPDTDKGGVRINDDLFQELLSFITNEGQLDSLYYRLDKMGVHPRSGFAILSALFPEDFYYNHKGVLIVHGIIVKGQLKKAHVGNSHRSIIQELKKQYGTHQVVKFLTEAPWVINKWIIERGFTVGIADCISLEKDENGIEYDKNAHLLRKELANLYLQLDALGGKLDDPVEEEYRQKQFSTIVNIASAIGMRLAKESMKDDNSVRVMTDQGAGTKGAIGNIGQMFGAVGQQYYLGQRFKNSITGGRRTLPMFDLDDEAPEAHAFIPRSLFMGITPEQLFQLQSGGREGLTDTALKTAETGSMSHLLIKALENIIIAPDGSIRNTVGTLFSPMYNCGYNVAEMLAIGRGTNSNFSCFIDIKATAEKLNIIRGWIMRDVKARAEANRQLHTDHREDILRTDVVGNVEPPKVEYDITKLQPVQDSVIKLTKFEKSRIIGARARQLENDADPMIEVGDIIDPIKIAMLEYDQGILPIYVIRKYPNGQTFKVYPTLDNIA